jgi:hypothetical protein
MSGWATEEIATLRGIIVAGGGVDEVSVALKKRRADVEAMVRLLGLPLSPVATLEWCDRCCSPRTHLDPITGWCEPCTTRHRLEQQRRADEEEERRLREEAAREANVIKTARKRMREQYGANPRKGSRKK